MSRHTYRLQAELHTKFQALRVNRLSATSAHLNRWALCFYAGASQTHQLPYPVLVNGFEGVPLENGLFQITRQEAKWRIVTLNATSGLG